MNTLGPAACAAALLAAPAAVWASPPGMAAPGAASESAPAEGGAASESAPAEGGTEAKAAEPAGEAEPAGGVESSKPEQPEVEWHRRADFMVGLHVGVGLGAGIGYPNDALKIDRPEFETNTGASGGGAGTFWIGGALADWLSFGVALSGARLVGGGYQTSSGSVGFHTEVFPAFSLGELGEDFGVYVDAGIALLQTVPTGEDSPVIESGGAGRFGLGGFYEGLRVWQLSMGPYVGADLVWSPTCVRPIAVVGWRTALYSGP
ncbi:MAG: hypothetical protein HY908_17095 [Myxococcales bacterium]|nr:hypothetical protein [Myxococcales bacterium]